MKRHVLVALVFLSVLTVAFFALNGPAAAKDDLQVMEDSATGPGGGGDSDGLPFEEQIEDVADAVADAVGCVVDAYEGIIQDAEDLVSEIWELDKTIVKLISEAAKSVADLYLEYQTFFLQAAGDAASNIKDDLEEARRLRDQAADAVAAPEGGGDGQQTLSDRPFANSGINQIRPSQDQTAVSAASGQTGAESGASAREILDAMDLGAKRIEELDRDLNIVRASLMRTVQETIDKIKAKVEAAVALAEEVLLGAIRIWKQVLTDFMDNPCDFLNPVGTAGDIVTEVNTNLQAMIDPIKALRNDVPGAFTEAQSILQQVQDNADAARDIVQSMRTLQENRDRGALLALNESVAASRSMVRQAAPTRETLRSLDQGAGRAEIDKATANAIRVTENVRRRVGILENRMGEPVRTALAGRQKLAEDLDRLFTGQSPQMAEKIKAGILTRIRANHPGDNQLVFEARNFLDREVSARTVSPVMRPLVTGGRVAAAPPAGSTSTPERPETSNLRPVTRPGGDPSAAASGPSPSPAGQVAVMDLSTPEDTADPRPRAARPGTSLSAQPPGPTPRTAVLKPSPAVSEPSVTGMTRIGAPLVRGGATQELTVTGSGLDRIRIEVVRGGRIVSDVNASVRMVSAGSLRITLNAPSTFEGSGDDYFIRILSGGRIIRQERFSVQLQDPQAPARPVLRLAPASPGGVQ